MIIKTEKINDNEKMYYTLTKTHIEIIKETNGICKIIKHIPILKNKTNSKSLRKTLFFFLLLCFLSISETKTFKAIQAAPQIVKHYFLWDEFTKQEQINYYIEDNNRMLEKNKNLTDEEEENLKKEYTRFINSYISYLNREDYWKTLLSSCTVKTQKSKKETYTFDNFALITVAEYDPRENIIFYSNNEASTLFHEKMHADSISILDPEKTKNLLQEELRASIGSNSGYESLLSIYYLLSELVGKDIVLKSIFTKDDSILWNELKQQFPNYQKEIQICNLKIKEYYVNVYLRKNEDIDIKKITKEFLENYQILFKSKYGYLPEKDVIASFEIDAMLGYKKNYSSFVEKDFYISKEIKANKEHRNQNYRDVLLQEIQKDYLKSKYLYLFITNLQLLPEDIPWTYEDLEKSLSFEFSEEEVKAIFDDLYKCEEPKEFEEYQNMVLSAKLKQK